MIDPTHRYDINGAFDRWLEACGEKKETMDYRMYQLMKGSFVAGMSMMYHFFIVELPIKEEIGLGDTIPDIVEDVRGQLENWVDRQESIEKIMQHAKRKNN